jgi:hypothetical protein
MVVIPAKAGIQGPIVPLFSAWMSTSAGTMKKVSATRFQMRPPWQDAAPALARVLYGERTALAGGDFVRGTGAWF